jgi:glycosyltransferase involved in cell wall biosynthesis
LLVWIVNPYGTLPSEGWRAYRSTLLARALTKAGHEVVWWVSNFDHRAKRFRAIRPEAQTPWTGFTIEVVPAPAYAKHISFARIRYEQAFAARFAEIARSRGEPDVLVLAEPALFTGGGVRRYLRNRSTALVVDIIDLWPELFGLALPRALRPLGNAIFWPLLRRRARLLGAADGIVAVCRDYLSVVPNSARAITDVVYWGVDVEQVRLAEPPRRSDPSRPVRVVYAGTLGDNYDILTILDAAELLRRREVSVQIVIAGDGPRADDIVARQAAGRIPEVEFVGRVDATALSAIYAECDVALCSYVGASTVSMPIKVYDYLAAGLAIVNSLGRDLGGYVVEREVGLQYRAEDASSLADVIQQLAEDRLLLARCRQNAYTLATEFDAGAQYEGFVRLIERVRSCP